VVVCHRYVESYPVRADLVFRPEDYPWSSYRHNALGTKDPLVRDHATYTALGATDAARRAAYRDLFGLGLTGEQVETIRDATQRGSVPGTNRFRQKVERALGRRVDPPRRGRPPKTEKTGQSELSHHSPPMWS
jgi:putative transposase